MVFLTLQTNLYQLAHFLRQLLRGKVIGRVHAALFVRNLQLIRLFVGATPCSVRAETFRYFKSDYYINI